MIKREFYTVEDLKEFLNYSEEKYLNLSDYCQKNKISMIIPFSTSVGQSIPSIFKDTEPDMPGAILYNGTILFNQVLEIVTYWFEERNAEHIIAFYRDDKEKMIELMSQYLVAFSHLVKQRKAFPVTTEEIYKIEELWMKEGYISFISIYHFKKGFSEEAVDKLKNIDESMFFYIADAVEQTF